MRVCCWAPVRAMGVDAGFQGVRIRFALASRSAGARSSVLGMVQKTIVVGVTVTDTGV